MSTFTAGVWAFAARKFADWAEFFQRLSAPGQGSAAGREQADPPLGDSATVETGRAESGAPADWLARLDSGGPPAHWLELLQHGDPEWIDASPPQPPAEAALAPAPSSASVAYPAPSPLHRHAARESSIGRADVRPTPPAEPGPAGRLDGPAEVAALTVEPQGIVPARPAKRRLSFKAPSAPVRTGSPPLSAESPPSVRDEVEPSPPVEPERRAAPTAASTASRVADPPPSLAFGSKRRMEVAMHPAPGPLDERESPVAEVAAPGAVEALPANPPQRQAPAPQRPVSPADAAAPARLARGIAAPIHAPGDAVAAPRNVALEARRPARDAAAPLRAAADAPPTIEGRWPTLPEEPPRPVEDWAVRHRDWERRWRLDREQRGT